MEKVSAEELSREISEETGLHAKDVKQIIKSMSDLIVKKVASGRQVRFPGLGIFRPTDREARTMVVPRTGKVADVPAKRSLVFKASEANRRL